ncbi:hypothetical protein AB205_0094060 [Aquarana catesbeiana]|uniref:Uncharacterized protein n=1 Tax=Aquarana catesbeiana TaxID=8400 RepID=A0A2G9RL96_AQUCT|nr:hypothetical protein AB205_0094060 [Aquarana catesbeiana]
MMFTINANNGHTGICDKLLTESSKAEPFRLIVQQLRLHNVMLLEADVLLGYTLVALCSPGREMSRRHVYPLTPSPVLPKTTVQAISVEVNLTYAALGTPTERLSITPTKKVEMDRTVMPDGTLITTVTTIQSRPKFDGKMDTVVRSPTKVEVSENKPVVLPHTYSSGSFPGGNGNILTICDKMFSFLELAF